MSTRKKAIQARRVDADFIAEVMYASLQKLPKSEQLKRIDAIKKLKIGKRSA
jgi:hypothetical protein